MHRRMVSLVAAGALVTSLGVFVAPGVALAEDPPTPVPPAAVAAEAPVPVINPTSGPPGTVIAVTVPGCTGIVSAALVSEETEDILGFTAGAGPTINLAVPAATPQGEIAVVAGCDVYEEGDLNFVTFTVTAGAVVAQPHVTG
jgi:hypothetical protein